jgi:subtilisin family serine protease
MRTVQGFPDIMAIAARSATALAFVLGLASAAMAQIPGALSQKSPDAAEIVARVQQKDRVRIIVMFQPPVAPSEVRPDAASIAAVKAQVAAIQDAIIAAHFGSAAAPRPGPGFARGLTRFEITPGLAVTVTRAELEALAADPNVASISYDRAVPPSLIDSVPLIGMPNAYAAGATGAGYAVAVLDTGVQANHEFLAGKVIAEACFSFGSGDAETVTLCPNGTPTQIGAGAANPETAECLDGATQLCDHGTHVAGIAAGFNASPQAGRPPNGVARNGFIWAIQVFTRFNSDEDCGPPGVAPCPLAIISDQIRALDHVFANMNNLPGGVRLASVNMSLGGGAFTGTCDTEPQKPGIDRLRNVGVLTVIAAGNDSRVSEIGSPACISTGVAVAASTKTDMISSFSNMSAKVELVAPGGANVQSDTDPANIQSAVPVVPPSTSAYLFFPGTSMAAPHVAGAIAAIRTVCTSATADAIEAALRNTGTPITDNRPGGTQTKPRIRVDLAVQSLNCALPPAPPPTCMVASQLGDFNGDSRSDFLYRRDGDGSLLMYLMNGFQVLGAQVIGQLGLDWRLAGVRDFNGDGRADILFHRTDGTLQLHLMNGFQRLDAQVIGQLGTDWRFQGLADFNGDGRADMLFRRTDGTLLMYLMNGFQVLAAQVIGQLGSEWTFVGANDFNGDGRADMLFRRTDGSLLMYLMNGFQVLGAQVIGQLGAEWRQVGLADFNGDGRADMLFQRTDGSLLMYLMNGFQSLGAQIIGQLGTDWIPSGLGDLNGDGRADMVFRRTDGTVLGFLMNGFQTLAAQVIGQLGSDWNGCYGQPGAAATQVSASVP